MASISIFTYDHDPPRVSSPWSTPPPGSQGKHSIPQDSTPDPSRAMPGTGIVSSNLSTVDYSNITKLEAEPQNGPTEYKLHLLLRRRRSFTRSTTGKHVSGSLRRIEPSSGSRSASESVLAVNSPTPTAASQSRQHRLEQLTTQLYWRLQQSCPHHVSSSSPLVIPQFPDEAQLSAPVLPRRLLPGLEESKGALYEIGVADDGTLVGLAEDEMEESLGNLRAMAASLGCRVDVLRMVEVGECEWLESNDQSGIPRLTSRTGKLWVAEALVHPDRSFVDQPGIKDAPNDYAEAGASNTAAGSMPAMGVEEAHSTTQQLRISLTGATMSGKSSLLGSLSTSTLDNGRGSSRLSLLKHRHEIDSGMTSSVTQELIGYRDVRDQEGKRKSTDVISFGTADISEWLEIHASAQGGRLVFLSDSPGLPRYRRTTVRGLIGWDPHWTLLCISADTAEQSPSQSQESVGAISPDVDLSQAHLQLCLKLELPLVVVVTKVDLATRQSLRHTVSRVLSAIKDSGKIPRIISRAPEPVSDEGLNTVSADELEQVGPIVQALELSPLAEVPIILTSAVKGIGITILHALLRELPLPSTPEAQNSGLQKLFYIEDVYSKFAAAPTAASLTGVSPDRLVIIAGHVRYGTLRIGQELLLGPFALDTSPDDSDSGSGRRTSNRPQRQAMPTSRSFPGALHQSQSRPGIIGPARDRRFEWRRSRITSLRNLRLPVRSLHAGQVGSIGLAPVGVPITSPDVPMIRKGMVLVDGATKPQAHSVVTVRFDGPNAEAVKGLSVGSGVDVYVASVRAPSTVVSVAVEKGAGPEMGVQGPWQHPSGAGDAPSSTTTRADNHDDDAGFGFSFDEEDDADFADEGSQPVSRVVTFRFNRLREFYEVGAKVLVMPTGGPGLYGSSERGEKGVAALDGFVGRVVEGY